MTTAAPESADLRTEPFWSDNQPGFRFSSQPVGSPGFFADVEAHRYGLEPHVPEVVGFRAWRDRDVLEAGCGIATDGLQFARAGARYTGYDQSASALALARRRFQLEGREARFQQGSVTQLPFEDESFDLVFSHGVIHHLPDTAGAVREFRRVLRPGGTALVMLYHRRSLNYYVNILGIRRALAGALLLPRVPELVARATGERQEVLGGHRALLREHGLRYLTDTGLFLSNNTDGPGNPLSKVYSSAEARALFTGFEDVRTTVRFLNLRVVPGGDRVSATAVARRAERRLGWHLYVAGRKP